MTLSVDDLLDDLDAAQGVAEITGYVHALAEGIVLAMEAGPGVRMVEGMTAARVFARTAQLVALDKQRTADVARALQAANPGADLPRQKLGGVGLLETFGNATGNLDALKAAADVLAEYIDHRETPAKALGLLNALQWLLSHWSETFATAAMDRMPTVDDTPPT